MTILRGKVEDGKLIIDREAFQRAVVSLNGKEIDVIIRKKKHPRSTPQNNYLWGVAYKLISEYTGYSSDEVHEICRMKFLGLQHREVNGNIFFAIPSTTTLSTMEFMEYISQIQQFGAEIGVVIPDPNETI